MIAATRVTVLILILAVIFTIIRHRDDDSITECSQRNKPQRWDGQKWTCK